MRKGRRPEEITALEEISHQAKAAKDFSEIEFARQEQLLKANATPLKDYDASNYSRMSNIARLSETYANLAAAKLGSREDQIRAWAAYCESLKANIEALKWKLEQKSQAAPKSGRVFDSFHREGEYVVATSPVVAILPPGNVKLRFFIGEPQLGLMKPGMKIRYTLSGASAPKEATVSYISPEVEFTPPVIFSRENRSKLVYMIEARPEAADAASLNVGAPLDVFQGEPEAK